LKAPGTVTGKKSERGNDLLCDIYVYSFFGKGNEGIMRQHQIMIKDVPALPSVPVYSQVFFGTMLCGWISVYIYFIQKARKENQPIKNNKFHKALFWHDLHAVTVVVLAALSLYNFYDGSGKEELLSEYTPIAFTSAYFVVDLVDCLIRRDVPFTVHASLSLVLAVRCGSNPVHFFNRSASRGMLTELSTFSLHRWQNSKSYFDFLTFCILFTLCRIVWIPYFIYTIYTTYEHMWDSQQTGMMGIFILNLTWWFKMMHILFDFKHPVKGMLHKKNDATINANGGTPKKNPQSRRSRKED
jgi:hypothetical protein